jgi:hypothetical protein
VNNDFWLRVVMHRSGKVETFKYCRERLICGATGHDFNSAMIHTTMLGLAPDEPPTSKLASEIQEYIVTNKSARSPKASRRSASMSQFFSTATSV